MSPIPEHTNQQQPETQAVNGDTIRAGIESLQKRIEHRKVADAKRSLAPTILGITAGVITAFVTQLQQQYKVVLNLVRQLRHAELNPEHLAQLRKESSQINRIYNRLEKNGEKIGQLVGLEKGAKVPGVFALNTLFERFTSEPYYAVNENLRRMLEKVGSPLQDRFRRKVDEVVVDTLHTNNIVSFDRRHMTPEQIRGTFVMAGVFAVAVGAVVYAASHLLTRESKAERKQRAEDEVLVEEARKAGFAALIPDKKHRDAEDFRQRLQSERADASLPTISL